MYNTNNKMKSEIQMKKMNKNNIGMFIDCDNVSAKYIESIFDDLSQYGTVNIRRAYGNWKDKKLSGWENVLQDEFEKNYMQNLKQFLIKEKVKYTIYPNRNDIFNAFNSTPFNNVKVVILGQDPYHGEGQANGLSFSVSDKIKTPPSLVNIFKEIDIFFMIFKLL